MSLEEDYVQVFECDNCHKGYIAKCKDNTVGFRMSWNFLCKICGVKSKKGKLIHEEIGTDFLPSEFKEFVKQCETDKEYKVWNKIWFSNK